MWPRRAAGFPETRLLTESWRKVFDLPVWAEGWGWYWGHSHGALCMWKACHMGAAGSVSGRPESGGLCSHRCGLSPQPSRSEDDQEITLRPWGSLVPEFTCWAFKGCAVVTKGLRCLSKNVLILLLHQSGPEWWGPCLGRGVRGSCRKPGSPNIPHPQLGQRRQVQNQFPVEQTRLKLEASFHLLVRGDNS